MYCINCGKKMNDNQRFCTNCGTENIKNSNKQEKKNNSNVLAIIGLITALLFSGIIGLILSIAGLFESKKLETGKTLSIVGIVISSIKILLTIIIIIFFSASIFTIIFDDIKEELYDEHEIFDKKDVNNLEMDEVKYNDVLISFSIDYDELEKLNIDLTNDYINNIVEPGKTSKAGRIGKLPGGADIEVINESSFNKKVKDCEVYKATFNNPEDDSERVFFVGGINYKTSEEEVKNIMKNLRYTSVIEETSEEGISLKYFDDDDKDEFIIFQFSNNILKTVTIQMESKPEIIT